jgi:hypothetical protein
LPIHLAFLDWLQDTAASTALRESMYMYPGVESVHVLSLCLFLGMAMILDLRLLGVAVTDTPVSEFGTRILPWIMGGFVVMVASGLVLFFGDPVRFANNVFFQAKMVMLVLAAVNAGIFHNTVWHRLQDWDAARATPKGARLAGGISLVLWVLIVVSGRMIAYNWFNNYNLHRP